MAQKHPLETVNLSDEGNVRALMRQIQKEEYGKDFFQRFFPDSDTDIEVVSHVVGKPPVLQQILYVNWYERTYLDWNNFKDLRKPGYDSEEPETIPLYLRLMLSYQRKSRAEGIKAMVGDAMEKARSIFSFHPKG